MGSFRFDLSAAPAGSPVRCEIAYDLNGVVRVSVSQPGADNAKTVALKLADAGREAEQPAAAARPDSEGVVVRKARALMPALAADDRTRVDRLLGLIGAAEGDAARTAAEDELLDLLLALEDARGGDTLSDAPT